MRYIKRNLLILAMAITISSGHIYSLPVQAEAAAQTETKEAKEMQEKKNNLKKWLNICNTMGKNLHKKGFRYSYSSSYHTYKAAVAGRRRTNCAQYVSWCMQEYGAIKKGQTFYVNGGGRIKKRFSWNSTKVSIIKVYKKCKKVKLQAGDVICWKGHVNIYAGRSKSGKRTWYDAGTASTYGRHNGSRYKSFKAYSHKHWDNSKICYIIRIKDFS